MTQTDLNKVVEDHRKWLRGEVGGTRADLTRANLTRANLTDANLRDANLTDANLTRADLTRANLTHANLTHANLRDANLRDANLTDANLRRAVSSAKNVSVSWHKPDPTLPRRVAEAALKPGCLQMDQWHTCETTHCLAGWAIQLSGQLGQAVEALTSSSMAGCILMPSAAHMFFADNEKALAWCREQVEKPVESAPA